MTEWGLVNVLVVKINASARAATVDELEDRTKAVIVNMLDTIHNSVARDLGRTVASPAFQARLASDKDKDGGDYFIRSITDESARRVKVYKDKDGMWYVDSTNMAKAVEQALVLPRQAKNKIDLWFGDPELTCYDMGATGDPACYHDFQRAHSKALARRRQALKAAEASRDDGAVAKLALEDCAARGWIAGEGALEAADDFSGQTPLWTQAFLGESLVVRRLLQAKADPEAVPPSDKERKTPLLCAAKEGHVDIVQVLVDFKANVHFQQQITEEGGMGGMGGSDGMGMLNDAMGHSDQLIMPS